MSDEESFNNESTTLKIGDNDNQLATTNDTNDEKKITNQQPFSQQSNIFQSSYSQKQGDCVNLISNTNEIPMKGLDSSRNVETYSNLAL